MEMKNWFECWNEEKKIRKAIDPKKICTFGIAPLDDALIGMLKNDLIVIGADTGVGKSDLCLNIALHNASQGKKVGLYYIEGGANEAIARIKWKFLCDKYYTSGLTGVDMDYRKWRMNLLDSENLDKLELECILEMEHKLKDNLDIYSFEKDFKIINLEQSLGWFTHKELNKEVALWETKVDVDLIIIDHQQSIANGHNY
ncbi:MAG: DnaB-like helicase C-terminal domain-containing protein, partial [Nanoarchaeota archaeon]